MMRSNLAEVHQLHQTLTTTGVRSVSKLLLSIKQRVLSKPLKVTAEVIETVAMKVWLEAEPQN